LAGDLKQSKSIQILCIKPEAIAAAALSGSLVGCVNRGLGRKWLARRYLRTKKPAIGRAVVVDCWGPAFTWR